MSNYIELSVDQAYRLVGHGPVVWISTYNMEGQANIAPIAWNMPVSKSPCRVLVAVGRKHLTHANILATGQFIVSVPTIEQVAWVRQTGSVSGTEKNKFEAFAIPAMTGTVVKAKIPEGCLGYIECALTNQYETGTVSLFEGEYRRAAAHVRGFKDRVLIEHSQGRTLHHLGEKIFAAPAAEPLFP